MIIKRQFKMYNITIHNTQHLCLVENVAKHSVRYNGVLHFDPGSLIPLKNVFSLYRQMNSSLLLLRYCWDMKKVSY